VFFLKQKDGTHFNFNTKHFNQNTEHISLLNHLVLWNNRFSIIDWIWMREE